MIQNFELTVEQQFHVAAIAVELQRLSDEKKNELILDLMKMMLMKDNIIKDFIGREVGRGLF
jgi:Phycobilisome degradation protein nblA